MIVFQQFIVLADSEGIVDYMPEALSRRTGIPLDIIEHGIAKLEEPDSYSRSTDLDGRRITLLDDHRPWGWSIVNYVYYRDLATREDQRVKARNRKRKQRESQSQTFDSNGVSQDVTDGHAKSRMSRHEDADVDVDVDVDVKPTTAPSVPDVDALKFEQFKKAYPKRSGAQPWSRARRAINARFRESDDLGWTDLIAGAVRYAAYCEATANTGTQYVMQAATFCGPDKHFLVEWELPATDSNGKTKRQRETTERFLANTERNNEIQ